MEEPNETPIEETPEATPETPEVPETPEIPEVPETPEVPEVPEAPEEPETPEEPEAPEEPIDPDKVEIETRGTGEEPKVEYGDEVDPEDIKTIGGIVDKQTAGVRQQLQETQDKLEVDAYLKDNPDFAKYRPVMLKYINWVDPKDGSKPFQRLAISDVAAIAASKDLVKIGAKKERDAQAKADATKTKGSPARTPVGGRTDWQKASKDQFEAQKNKVMGRDI